MVALGTEQEVHHEHRDGGARDDHEAEADEQEAEHVVDAASPDRVHDEVELDEAGAEGQHADQQHRRERPHVSAGRRNLPRDLVGADRRCDRLRFEAQPTACQRKRHRDHEPDHDDHDHGREWYRSGCPSRPHEQVEEEEHAEDE